MFSSVSPFTSKFDLDDLDHGRLEVVRRVARALHRSMSGSGLGLGAGALDLLDDGGGHLGRVDLGQVLLLFDVIPDARLAGDVEGVRALGRAGGTYRYDKHINRLTREANRGGTLNRGITVPASSAEEDPRKSA